jgi:hypothetical protein
MTVVKKAAKRVEVQFAGSMKRSRNKMKKKVMNKKPVWGKTRI